MARLYFYLLAALALAGYSSAFTTYIHAPAVLLQQNNGTLTVIALNITPGNGRIYISGPSSVGNSTLVSAKTAVGYATSLLGLNTGNYNYHFVIMDNNSSVSGPSAGLAMTLLTINNLEHRGLYSNFTVTGTIAPNGSVGEIGGIYDKVEAAKAHGMRYVVVPYAQNGSFEYQMYYLSQQSFGIPLVEVSNATQAINYSLGTAPVKGINYTLLQNYSISSLPQANVSCNDCNIAPFAKLANFTFSMLNGKISDISQNYSPVKSSAVAQLGRYRRIAAKGYIYAAADMAFLDYVDTSLFYNYGDYNYRSAYLQIKGIEDSCNGASPPPMTSSNYEYLIGGELRNYWGSITANESMQALNASNTTDGIIESLYSASEASAWCSAASELYNLSSYNNGTSVELSPSVKAYAAGLLANDSVYGNNTYTQTAEQSYRDGNYAVSVYASEYAAALGTDALLAYNNTNVAMLDGMLANMSASGIGVWPAQFADEAEFYIYEASRTGNYTAKSQYLSSAYSVLLLADRLSQANKEISSSFVSVNTSRYYANYQNQNITKLYNLTEELQGETETLLSGVVAISVLLFAILIVLLFVVIKVFGGGGARQQPLQPAMKTQPVQQKKRQIKG
jgi:uncharacterized protein